MAVAVRLKRIGKSLYPVYRVVAIDSKKRTGGQPLEELGKYNPRNKKNMTLNIERLNYWIKTGAVVSAAVKSIIKKNVPAQ
ncbi:MAG: 30S ribosomal protein S16 [Elusimicrobia bacterium CG06_land_8_20_14_3_00_38_11]|nr:MAG: 30S ribosomal protein S16 [Elusimicrobia bacterium CG06_land_8_20_14_3_00_38_11]